MGWGAEVPKEIRDEVAWYAAHQSRFDLVVDTGHAGPQTCAKRVVAALQERVG